MKITHDKRTNRIGWGKINKDQLLKTKETNIYDELKELTEWDKKKK